MARAEIAWLVAVVVAVALTALVARLIVRRANRSLRARERRYRDLVAESFGLICTHDLKGVLLMVNPAARPRQTSLLRPRTFPAQRAKAPRAAAVA